MTQTPEERAQDAAAAIFDHLRQTTMPDLKGAPCSACAAPIAAAIRAAVAAETERCARIVDPTRGCTAAVLSARIALAAAIREAPPPQEGT